MKSPKLKKSLPKRQKNDLTRSLKFKNFNELLFTEDEKIPEFEQPIVVYEGGYIPARKAAVKATTQMKDVDRKVSAKEEELLLFGEDPKKAKKAEEKNQKAHKKDHLPSLLENLRSPLSDSDSMDEEPFPFRSPRGKSSRGRTSGGQVNKFCCLLHI